MTPFQIFRETSLPDTLQNDSIYLVAPLGTPNYIEFYVVNSIGAVRRIPTDADITAKVNAALAVTSGLLVVDTIAARDALAPSTNVQVLVKDATGDTTVVSGAATYVYEVATTTWTKISESESLDVVLNWASIIGKPTSTAAAIDSAVAASHTHSNKTVLDAISQDASGNFNYNAALPKTGWASTNW